MKSELVEYLIDSGILERKDIQRCVLRASMKKGSVVSEMIDGFDVDEQNLATTMADYWGLTFSEQASLSVHLDRLGSVPERLARKFGVLPVEDEGDAEFTIAVFDVDRAQPIIEQIRDKTGRVPALVVTTREAIHRQIARHYGGGEPPQQGESTDRDSSSAPAQGVMRKKARTKRPERTTKSTRPGQNDGSQTAEVVDLGEPTRQVEVGMDNPFMDLVQQTADPDGTVEVDQDEEESDDFFDEFDDESMAEAQPSQDSEPSSMDEDSGGAVSDVEEEFSTGLAEALEEFNADLDSEAEEVEPELIAARSSSLEWGEFQDGDSPLIAGRGSRPDGGTSGRTASSAPITEESGVFPVDRNNSGLFDFPEEHEDHGLTLAEVVDRQRRIIDKLEREIEYQKGILQTMAELLVEARVLSKRKLKDRLKSFKDAQRNKQKKS